MPKVTLDELARRYGEVQLATLATATPPGDWSYESKWDGYRIVALKTGEQVRLLSRNGKDWTHVFPAIADAVRALSPRICVLDGEACALDARGVPRFQLLQHRDGGSRLAYYVFDVLDREGADLRAQPIEARRKTLRAIVPKSSVVKLSTAVSGVDEKKTLAAACAAGLEGIVAKAAGSAYTPGRTRTWLKLKCSKRQEVAIVGFTPLKGTQPVVGALLVAVWDPTDRRFHFAGKVGTGYDTKSRKELADLLRPDVTPHPNLIGAPRASERIFLVEPRHVAEVSFTEWTAAGRIRHPVFQGLRRDKRPRDCIREHAT